MASVLLTEYIHPDARRKLEEHFKIVDSLDNADDIFAIVVRTYKVDAQVMDKCKNLKIVAKHGVGVNTIDLETAKERGIIVTNTPHANSNSVAELVVALMLDVCRNVTLSHEKTRKGDFEKIAPSSMTGLELAGKTLGLIGFGNIAQRVAEICRGGFGMKCVGYDPFVCAEKMAEEECTKYESVKEVIERADIINVSVPLTAETKDLISGAIFNFFRPGAVLVNAARGGIVNEDDLYEALKCGKLRAAACDAFLAEPPTEKNTRLFELENFVGTPHIGACAEEALWRMGDEMATSIIDTYEEREPKYRLV